MMRRNEESNDSQSREGTGERRRGEERRTCISYSPGALQMMKDLSFSQTLVARTLRLDFASSSYSLRFVGSEYAV